VPLARGAPMSPAERIVPLARGAPAEPRSGWCRLRAPLWHAATAMPGLIERYRERLPFAADDPVVSLEEGSTPLVSAPRISERVGADVWLKLEGANPTGSFKDRGMTCAVSAAVREGAEAVICASTGNTAASAAAYAARAGLRGAVIVPEGKIATGKLAQALMHGARVIALRGNFDQALALVRELAQRRPIALVNSVNEFRIAGQKTAAFEVLEALGELDALCIPVGNAGNVTAYWRGFQELGASPRMLGFQAEGAAPLVLGHPVAQPETIASAIRIGNPARWEDAMAAMTASGGAVRAVSDAQILTAYRLLAAEEGVFCEPASAAGVAGLLAHGAEGASTIVCVLTGHGLKDPDTALEHAGGVVPCEPDIAAVEASVFA
jgi:threonine synthase